jgi:uncharacterized membrane protein
MRTASKSDLRVVRSHPHMQNIARLLGSTSARQAFVVVMAMGTLFIAFSSFAYVGGDELHPFVLEKLPLPLEDVWLFALQVHVVTAVLSLPACLLLLSKSVLTRFSSLHRNVGRVTGVVILTALVPSGLYLALFAKGGLVVTAGFVVSGLIVAWSVVAGVRSARERRMSAHRRAMAHVTAQLSVAVTSRAMLVLLDAMGMAPDIAYVVALWIPVALSALAVEVIFARPEEGARAFERNTHEVRSPPRLVVHAHR